MTLRLNLLPIYNIWFQQAFSSGAVQPPKIHSKVPQDTRPLQSGAASILYGLSSLYSLELSRRHKSRCAAVSRLASGAGKEGPALQAVHAEVGGGCEGRVGEGVAPLGPPLVQVRVKPEPELSAARSDHKVLTRPLRQDKFSICSHHTNTNKQYLFVWGH